MRHIARQYWMEILVFGAVFGVLLLCNLPAMTWINTDSDGPHYILSAKYFQVAHNMSQPLFLLLGRLFLFLPFGTEAWRMGLISVMATTGCAVLIYMVVRYHLADNLKTLKPISGKRHYNLLVSEGWRFPWGKHKVNVHTCSPRYYAVIASLVYGGSALVISQSTIIETYALATLMSVWAYYMSIQKRWLFTSILLGIGLAVHPGITAFCWIVLFVANKAMRHWKWVLVTGSFLLFYLYVPLVGLFGESLSMWGNETPGGFAGSNMGMVLMYAGGLAMMDLPKRILDTLGIFGVSLGLGIVIVAWYYIRLKKIKNALLWLILLPALYFIGNLASQTYVYLLPAIAYGAVVAGIGLSKMHMSWSYATLLVAVGLLAFNANYFDIGRTLDPNLSAQKFYDEELPKIKDGEIYLGGGWTWAITYLYNIEENRNIVPVCIDILPSDEYLGMMESQGINLVRTNSERHIDKQWEVALSIAENNPDVWITKETVPSQYECEVVPAKGNEWLMTRWIEYEKDIEIAWKPSNPYDFITGAIEVSEWKFILYSNRNCKFLLTWATFGYFLFWLVMCTCDRWKKRV